MALTFYILTRVLRGHFKGYIEHFDFILEMSVIIRKFIFKMVYLYVVSTFFSFCIYLILRKFNVTEQGDIILMLCSTLNSNHVINSNKSEFIILDYYNFKILSSPRKRFEMLKEIQRLRWSEFKTWNRFVYIFYYLLFF